MLLFSFISNDTGVTPENIVDIGMVDDYYNKLFNLQYSEDRNVGKLTYDAQQRGFKNKGRGTMIGDDATIMLIGLSDANYPILGKYTTTDDMLEAKCVMSSKCQCDMLDLEQWRCYAEENQSGNNNGLPDDALLSMLRTFCFFYSSQQKDEESSFNVCVEEW